MNIVTPWEVKGEVDYDRLIKEFGISKLDEKILERFINLLPLLNGIKWQRLYL